MSGQEPHKFKGREDRPCEECDLQDRNPIHRDAQGHDLRVGKQIPVRPTRFSEMAFWEKCFLSPGSFLFTNENGGRAIAAELPSHRAIYADQALAEWLKRWGEPGQQLTTPQ